MTHSCEHHSQLFAKDIMSALLSADAPLTQQERDNLLAQEEALKEQLRDVRAKLGKGKSGMYTALRKAVDKAPVLHGGAAEDMQPPTAEELKPSDAEIAGNAILDANDKEEIKEHYQKVYNYTIALKASLRDKDWIKKASVLLCADDADIPRSDQDHMPWREVALPTRTVEHTNEEGVVIKVDILREQYTTAKMKVKEWNIEHWNIQHGANPDFLGFSYGFLEKLINGELPSKDKKQGHPLFAEILSFIDRNEFFRFKVTCVKLYEAFNVRYLRKEEAELRKVCHKKVLFFLQ